MKYSTIFLLILALLAAGTLTGSGPVPPDVKTESGSLVEKVRQVVSGQFGPDTDLFRVPTSSEMKGWDGIVRFAAAGNAAEAAAEIKRLGFPYKAVLFTEKSNGKEYVVLEEDPRTHGWGFFAFDPNSESPLIIELPHPVSDARTEIEGTEAFVQTGARAMILSGVHRRANRALSPCSQPTENSDYRESDPAHATATMFHQTHETLVLMDPDTVAVQLHGMIEREVCPNVFLSTGTDRDTSIARKLLDCLTDRDVKATLYDGTESCPLIASSNVQGRFSNGVRDNPCGKSASFSPEPGFFIHAEQEPNIREGPESWSPVIEALKCAFPVNEKK